MANGSELAVIPEHGIVDSGQWAKDREKLDLLKRTICVGSTDDEFALFVHVAQKMGLDPFARQIHAVKRYNSAAGKEVMSIQVGIDGYRATAQKTGEYAGSDDYKFDEGLSQSEMLQANRKRPVTATATVWRIVKGTRCPFTATAGFEEYKATKKDGTLNLFWQNRPFLMLGKCAEALAMRKGFPAELAGTYTNDEMEQAGEATVSSAPPAIPLPLRRSEKQALKKASEAPHPAVEALGAATEPQVQSGGNPDYSGAIRVVERELDRMAGSVTKGDEPLVVPDDDGPSPLDDQGVIRAQVLAVSQKKGGEGKKAWVLTGVKYQDLANGGDPVWANTFDTTWGKLAEKAKAESLIALLTVTPSAKYDGKFDLASFAIEEPSEA